MPRTPQQSWPELAFASWLLMGEASLVVGLRMMRLMLGGARADREARRMVNEKIAAGLTLGPALLAGGFGQSSEVLGATVLAHYAKPVRANRRRLARRGNR